MTRQLLLGVVLAAAVLIALLGALVQLACGDRPLLLTGRQ
jgi:hypothetical protein